jgi:hypothetical protein
MKHGSEPWYDDEAGPLVRPYSVTRGRTQPARTDLDLITLVVSDTHEHVEMEPEYTEVLRLCRTPLSIAEISAMLALPVAVVKILVADLIEHGYVAFRSPRSVVDDEPPNMNVLRAVLDGIRRL